MHEIYMERAYLSTHTHLETRYYLSEQSKKAHLEMVALVALAALAALLFLYLTTTPHRAYSMCCLRKGIPQVSR